MATEIYANPQPILVPNRSSSSPYPSEITVARARGPITSLAVTLKGCRHTQSGDLDILLVGPGGQAAMLMSDAGGREPISDVDLTLSPAAKTRLPEIGPILSGTYSPTDYTPGESLPKPAPTGPFRTDLTIFNGTNPNGTWQLFVYDDAASAGSGAITRGWEIEIEMASPLVVTRPPQDQTVKPGDTATFQVGATGTPPLGYQWHLNGALLAGETNSTLTLDEVQAIDGGTFSVTVFNQNEAVHTSPAVLTVKAATDTSPTDRFRDRPRIQGFSGIVQGDSSRATSEAGEPVPKNGGKSVWFEWVAPSTGIVTFSAEGSAFDTILSVFSGSMVSELTPVVEDDDGGRAYTSILQFNAKRGEAYQIRLDGLGPDGGGGQLTVSWMLLKSEETVPMILLNPVPLVLPPGGQGTFRVRTASAEDKFQWFLNGLPLRGQTGSSLEVDDNPDSVGIYQVRVSNKWGHAVTSAAVNKEIGFGPPSYTQLKYQKSQANGNRPGAGFVSISLGGVVAKQGLIPAPGPPAPCGTSWGPLAQGLHAQDDGTIIVHTTGSSVPAKIYVYEGFHSPGETPIACGPEGNPSQARFDAVQGETYTVEVDGALVGGNITLSNQMGRAPDFQVDFHDCAIPPGGGHQLSVTATGWVPTPAYQWRLNEQVITHATNASLEIMNFDVAQAGDYSVVVSNFVRTATNMVASLNLGEPLTLSPTLLTNGGVLNLVVSVTNAAPFLLETKTDLNPSVPWLPVATNLDCQPISYTNSNLLADPQRFFRAVPWLPTGP